MGTIKPSDVARRMIPTSSASPAKRARGPRKRVRGRVRRLAILGRLAMGAAEAPVVDRDDGVVRGQQRHDVAPVGHGLRHAVQQEHRLAGAADRVVDLHAVDLGLAVREPDSSVVSQDDRIWHGVTDPYRLCL